VDIPKWTFHGYSNIMGQNIFYTQHIRLLISHLCSQVKRFDFSCIFILTPLRFSPSTAPCMYIRRKGPKEMEFKFGKMEEVNFLFLFYF
jgi:hypothetical protein